MSNNAGEQTKYIAVHEFQKICAAKIKKWSRYYEAQQRSFNGNLDIFSSMLQSFELTTFNIDFNGTLD